MACALGRAASRPRGPPRRVRRPRRLHRSAVKRRGPDQPYAGSK